jgi:hypothetical protein
MTGLNGALLQNYKITKGSLYKMAHNVKLRSITLSHHNQRGFDPIDY